MDKEQSHFTRRKSSFFDHSYQWSVPRPWSLSKMSSLFLESEMHRSRSVREETRNRSSATRQPPAYHHSHSTSAATTRASKMQSHILRRLASMRTTGGTTASSSTSSTGNTHSSNTTGNHHAVGPSTIDRILFDQMIDLSSIPIDLSTGKDAVFLSPDVLTARVRSALESDDPERLRIVIQETLSRLTGDTTLNENTVSYLCYFKVWSCFTGSFVRLESPQSDLPTQKCVHAGY